MASPVRQRIIGAIVIVALLAIFIPIFFTSHHPDQVVPDTPPAAPPMPVVQLKLPPMPASQAQTSDNKTSYAVPVVDAQPAQMPATALHPLQTQTAIAPVVRAQPTPAMHASHQTTAWRLQLGSFSYKTNSDRLVARLKQAGFEAYSQTVKLGHGKFLQQVYIGQAMTQGEAQQLQKHLSEKMHMPSMVKPYRIASYTR